MVEEKSESKDSLIEIIQVCISYDDYGNRDDQRVYFRPDISGLDDESKRLMTMFTIGATKVLFPTKEGFLVYEKVDDSIKPVKFLSNYFERTFEYVLVGRV